MAQSLFVMTVVIANLRKAALDMEKKITQAIKTLRFLVLTPPIAKAAKKNTNNTCRKYFKIRISGLYCMARLRETRCSEVPIQRTT